MKRIATPNRAVDLFGAGKDGYRSAVAGVSTATEFSAPWFNHIQEAIVRTLEAAGLALSDTDYDQFVTALNTLFVGKTGATGAVNMPVGTTAQRPPTPINGQSRGNTDLAGMEAYLGGAWSLIGKLKQAPGYVRANSTVSTTSATTILTASITPKSTSSRILILFMGGYTCVASSNSYGYLSLYESVAGTLGGPINGGVQVATASSWSLSGQFIYSPATLTTQNFSVTLGVASAGTASVFTGDGERSILLLEIE